ncbi:hypothetical protein JZ751_014020 [Albula glossodonta]|uniref:Uncharacterized protein n=1 Tax=Albula glossodonta TaxID=121402 RepID=A0A8T2MZB0_9TELE|nr:hypothetical protein JZ751_016980 [Albula glossodonta]KAG9332926.1 hypothetical protein JZ751_014020 [Albula glossodonta]
MCEPQSVVSGGVENKEFHTSRHLPHHEYSRGRHPACRYAMTQRDNCGSRLLQPLVSVTKIGTQSTAEARMAQVGEG